MYCYSIVIPLVLALTGVAVRALTLRGGIAAAIVGMTVAICTPSLFPALTVMVVLGIGATVVRVYLSARRQSTLDSCTLDTGDSANINDRILRGAGSVFGNGGAAVLFAAAFGVFGSINLQVQPNAISNCLDALYFATAGCIAAAAADTIAGEIGRAFRARTYSILTLKPVEIGANGGVSALGTIAGCAASSLIGVICAFFSAYVLFGSIAHFNWMFVVIVTLAGVVGCFVDSLVGATIEGKAFRVVSLQEKPIVFTVGNNETNFIGTFFGGVFALTVRIFM